MAKAKIGKTIGDAQARVMKTRAEYIRAMKAYNKWLQKEGLRFVDLLPELDPNYPKKGKKK